jgi:PhnB protein
MTTINTYLTFNGQCEEAFLFYKSVFKTEIAYQSKFNQMPADPNNPMSDEELDRVMHVSLPISEHSVLMGCDTGGKWGANYKEGTNFSVSINTDSKEEADRLFTELSAGGNVIMPMENTFWESYFGTFSDKFGIQWMVSFDKPMV